MARSRAMAQVDWVSHGQRCGRCNVRRRADRVIRPPGRRPPPEVLVVTIGSPKAMRAVRRARLCAMPWIASQAPLAAKRLDGMCSARRRT